MRNRTLLSFLVWVVVTVSVQGKRKDFVLQSGQPVAIACSGPEASVVHTSLDLLSRDLQIVLSAIVHINTNTGNVIVGTIGQSRLIEQAGIDISVLKNKRQALMLAISEDGKLVVAGNDSHGIVYGMLEVFRLLGAFFWEWWADVAPEKKETFRLSGRFRELQFSPVGYRGIFINDEDWGLMPRSNKIYELLNVKGEIGPRINECIFELLLRLRANTYWPVIHECTPPFSPTKGNREAAKKYGIFMGASYCEPMACNAAGEWKIRGKGAYDYVNNSPTIYQFWEDRVKEAAGQEVLYTLGMCGVHDGRVQGAKAVEEQKAVPDRVSVDQRGLFEGYVSRDVIQVSQVFIPYKGVLDIYHAGLQVPEDVTLMWYDDNYDYTCHLPTAEERARKGGNGVYYRVSYWGRPHNHLWLSIMSPSLIYQQIKQAYDQGIQKMWILNIGDIKPVKYRIELFMDMAWDLDKVSSERVTAHLKHWLERELGTSCVKTVLSVIQEHYRLAHIRKPELMGNTWEEEKSPVYRAVRDLPWSEREINEHLNACSGLSEIVEKATSKVPAGRQSTHFELVKYPTQAATQMNRKLLYAQLARRDKGDWEESDVAYDSIAALTQHYSSLGNGKWNRMTDFKPRKLPVFSRVERKAATASVIADRKAVCQWNAAEAKKGNATVCEGLRYENKAAKIKKGDALTFSFGNLKMDSVEVDIRLLPDHPVYGDKLRFTVPLDGAEPEVIAYETKGYSEGRKENTLHNQAIRKIALPVTGKKSCQSVIKALDGGVIPDQVMLHEVNHNSSDT